MACRGLSRSAVALNVVGFSRHALRLKRSLQQADFRNGTVGEPVCSDNRHKPPIVDFQETYLDFQQGSFLEPSHCGLSRAIEELERVCKEGQLDRAIDVLTRMDQEGIVPTVSMYRDLLKACAKRKALNHARLVHAHLAKHGLIFTKFLGENVVGTLVQCGGLADALQLFRTLPQRTVFSWTAVITGYVAAGQGREALRMYRCMQVECVQPNTYTLVSLLQACGSIADLQEGKRIHAEALIYSICSGGPGREGDAAL